ncbi:hypothetical protein GCM10022261_09650 [Brevibacterium daeguense]|uniref:SnoaL-like domain-containing protein n=1 Tax=Brevibacterium daeguense TaxID=909936 RepID=A0ABP8EHI9_9MICO|nr:hypothetical protein [Brevibacterium daeguense]
MSEAIDPAVEQFLVQYESALSTFDAEGSAALWGVPGTMVTDDFVGTLHSREQLAQALEQSYPLYRALGLSRVTHTLLERVDVTPRIIRLRVRWHFFGEPDEHLADSDYEYLLRRDEDGLHAYVAVGIDETEQLLDLAARKGVDVTQFGWDPPG